MLIALTGFMASGKTTVGRLLASSLGCPFLDLDEVIVQKAGHSIPAIFAADGEAGFRKLEKQALEQTVSRYAENTAVLALGGGTVTVPGAIKLLQEKTTCIYLQASLESIQARLSTHPGERIRKPPMSQWTRTALLRSKSRTRLSSIACNPTQAANVRLGKETIVQGVLRQARGNTKSAQNA